MDLAEHTKKLYEPYPEYKLVNVNGEWEIEYDEGYWPLLHPLDIELTAYRLNWNKQAFKYMKKAHDMLWPKYIPTWNDWSERRFRAHCEMWKTISLAGGSNIGKSVDAAKIAVLFWLANPTMRTVLVASTTLNDLDSRIWGYLKKLYDHQSEASIELPGMLYESSPPKIILSKKDTIHGLFTVPLQQGSGSKKSANLIGRHPEEGFLAIIDEGTDVAGGFFDAIPNWERAPIFQLIIIGNSNSAYDPHGILSTPKNGWDSVHPDYDTEWETRTGICLYFDCFQSPALKEKDPVKKKLLGKFLFNEESIKKAKEDYGENDPSFWRFTRGFWPPEDIAKTVLTALTVDKHKAREQAHWSGESKLIQLASVDPAFTVGGDACILRKATLGLDIRGKWVIDFGGENNIHALKFDVRSKDPIDYQIVQQVMNFCVDNNIAPENCAVDVVGTGTGLGSIFEIVWSRSIYKVDSIGGCSEEFINTEQTLTAKELYDRKVTELWFMMKRFVVAGQIRGLDQLSVEQFCTRRWDWKGRKISIEKKSDYKLRMGKLDTKYKSPDEADSACLLLDLARKRYGLRADIVMETPKEKSGMRKFFDYQHMMGDSNQVTDPTDPFLQQSEGQFIHPAAWGDGFVEQD